VAYTLFHKAESKLQEIAALQKIKGNPDIELGDQPKDMSDATYQRIVPTRNVAAVIPILVLICQSKRSRHQLFLSLFPRLGNNDSQRKHLPAAYQRGG
jgi:hypothetical protein